MAFKTGARHPLTGQLQIRGGFDVMTLSGALTLDDKSANHLILDPGGASRVVTLPASDAKFDGVAFTITNTADAGELLIVKNAAGVVVGLVHPQRAGTFGNEAGTWSAAHIAQPANALSKRYELKWTAGARGKPAINADILSATEATREIADPDFEVLGTNGVSASTAIAVEGGITCTTAGASGDQVIIAPHLDASQTAWSTVTWGTDQQVIWEAAVKTGAAITDAVIWAGLKLTNTSTTATDDNQVFFRYAPATNSGKWQAVYSIAGTDVSADAGVTVAVSSQYHLKVTIDVSRVPRFYINDALVATGTALADTIDLIPYIGVSASAVAAKSLTIYGQAISRVAA
jgi:hypothetical protein